MRGVFVSLDSNFKLPKRSQHRRLMSAAESNKQQVDTRSLTLFTCFLSFKAILSRFKQAHLAFPPAAENRGPSQKSESAIEHCFSHYTPRCLSVAIFEIKYFEKKITKIMITVRLSRDRKPKYPVRCPRSPGVPSLEGH